MSALSQGRNNPSTQLFTRVTNPQSGDVLTWDINTNEWINENILNLLPNNHVSGTYTNQSMTLDDFGLVTAITQGQGIIYTDAGSFVGNGSSASPAGLITYNDQGTYSNQALTFNKYGVLTGAASSITADAISFQMSFALDWPNGGSSPFSFQCNPANLTSGFHNKQTMTNGSFNTGTSTFTAGVAGLYRVSANAQFSTDSTGTMRGLTLITPSGINGGAANAVVDWFTVPPNSVLPPGGGFSCAVQLNANETLQIQGINNATAAINAIITISIVLEKV